MRISALVVLSFCAAIPAGAQRIIPRITPRPGLAGTVETERQPEPVARALAIQRSRVEIESYPLLNFNQAATVAPGVLTRGYTSAGEGVHVQYRGTQTFLASIDYATAFQGGPTYSQSVELGGRYRPSDFAQQFRPYVDVRGVWLETGNQFSSTAVVSQQFTPISLTSPVQYSRGFGALAGVGGEYWFATRFALTTGVDAIRTRMSTHDSNSALLAGEPTFWMNNYRLTVGLKFNQARTVALQ